MKASATSPRNFPIPLMNISSATIMTASTPIIIQAVNPISNKGV